MNTAHSDALAIIARNIRNALPNARDDNNMNAVRVVRLNVDKKPGADTILIPLPRVLWRLALPGSKCQCAHCVASGAPVAYWDTVAVAANAPPGSSAHRYTWMVHAPELQACK